MNEGPLVFSETRERPGGGSCARDERDERDERAERRRRERVFEQS